MKKVKLTMVMTVSDEVFKEEFQKLIDDPEEAIKQAAAEVDAEEGIYAVELGIELLPL